MGELRNAYRSLIGNLRGRNHFADLSVGGKIILEWILEKQHGKLWIVFIRIRIGPSVGLF
jgi:hypothetical protein